MAWLMEALSPALAIPASGGKERAALRAQLRSGGLQKTISPIDAIALYEGTLAARVDGAAVVCDVQIECVYEGEVRGATIAVFVGRSEDSVPRRN